MRDIAVISFAQAPNLPETGGVNDVEILMPVLVEALTASGIPRKEIGFTCSGSSDYLAGQPFSFVMGLDAVGPWPPITESHVEMDGAWALYEAWTRLQHGDLDSALVYAFGKSSTGDLGRVLALQLDPYTMAPLWPDPANLAALQARAYLDKSGRTEADLAEVATRSRRNAKDNPAAQLKGDVTVDELLAAPYVSSPLRAHDCPPISDGAAAIVLAAGDLARTHCARPAWIRGIDHRIEAHPLGLRDLTTSASTAIAADKTGVANGPVDVAELHAPYTHQELILRDALGLNGETSVNPSGGALAGNPMMSAGLARIGEAARRVIDGTAGRAVAHATSGACLQQNMVAVLEAD
jgi:acetyl-CoA acetyltransferase